MTDEEIIKAVRDGDMALVPMPGDGRKFFVGHYGDCDCSPNQLVLILDLDDKKYEGEEMIGMMMGGLTKYAMEAARDGDCDCDSGQICETCNPELLAQLESRDHYPHP